MEGGTQYMFRLIDPAGRQEWREHWPVVASAMAGMAACHVHLYSLGVMVAPLEKAFGWSRVEITSGLLIISMVLFPLSFFIGMAIDRIGPRRIALCGMAIYCLALAGLSQARPPIWTWWLLWVFLACGYMFLGPTVWVTAITGLFSRSRGLAIALMLCAVGGLSFICPMLTLFLIERVGWRMTYMLWGAAAAVLALPMLFLFFFSAADKDRARSADTTMPPSRTALRQDMKTAFFWRLAVAGPVMSVVFTAIIVNLVPILVSMKLSAPAAAAVAGVAGGSMLVGRLSGGALNDHFNPRIVASVIVIFPIISCVLLMTFAGSVAVAVIAALVFGLSAGAELDSLAYLASRYFDPRNFGALFGVIIGVCSLGSGLGPVLASRVYDLTGSYVPMFWALIPMCLLASYAFFSLGAFPDRSSDDLSPA